MPQFIVGLDIGSSSIKAAVSEVKKDGKLKLAALLKFPVEGMRKGMVSDISEVTKAVSRVISEIKLISKSAAKNIFLGIGSPHVRIQPSHGSIAVSRADLEISKDDITRVTEAAQAVKLQPNRMMVHFLTREFVVDDVGDIRDPLGMVGTRLEARSLIIDAFTPAIKSLTKCVEVAGGSVAGLIFNPLASARSVLSKNQMELGAAVVDIGHETTGIAVYQENKLLYTGSFHMGSGHITNDLAIGLKASWGAAEAIKLSYGSAVSKNISSRDTVEMSKFDADLRSHIPKRFLNEIIEVRLAEIFELVNNDLRVMGIAGKLPAGVILTGGGAKLPEIVDLARDEMRLPARIGIPDVSGLSIESPEVATLCEDPDSSCAIGLLLRGADEYFKEGAVGLDLGSIFKKVINYFVP